MLWLLLVVIAYTFISCTSAGQVYVRPTGNATCPTEPCLTLNEYARLADLYFMENTTFTFLPGMHTLDRHINIENVSGIEFRIFEEHQDDLAHDIILSPQINITWTDCKGIEISGLVFALSGDMSTRSVFSALIFERTNVLLSGLVLHGNGTWHSTAVRAISSQLTLSNVEVVGATGFVAAVLFAFDSTIDFIGQNHFVNCTSYDGGTIELVNSTSNFNGNISFVQNIAIPNSSSAAGALICVNSNLTFNGTAVFQHNQATITRASIWGAVDTSGAMLVLLNSKLTFETHSQALFSKNSGVLNGGAIRVSSSELIVRGTALFEGNSALKNGGAIQGGENAMINCSGQRVGSIKFLNNSVYYKLGGAIDSYSSSVELENIYFEGNKAGFGGAVGSTSGNLHIRSCQFVENQARFTGGAMYVGTSAVAFNGTNCFEINRAQDAGAVNVYLSNATFSGENKFLSNRADISTGGIVFILSNATFSGLTTFYSNQGFSGGGIYGIISNVTIGGNSSFINNSVDIWGGGVMFSNGTLAVTGHASFAKNAVGNSGLALYAKNSNITVSGTVSVSSGLTRKVGQVILDGGAITLLNCTACFTGLINISNITAEGGGCIHATDSEVEFLGIIHCHKNRALGNGGALYAKNSVVKLRSEDDYSIIFEHNVASRLGGAIFAIDSSLFMSNSSNFIWNTAEYGGALALDHSSKLILSEPLGAIFLENHASVGGGAIFYDDTFSRIQCESLSKHTDKISKQTLDCFIELSIWSTSNMQLNFVNNTADRSGSVLYGGNIDKCRLYVGGGIVDDCGNRIGGTYIETLVDTFQNLSNIVTNDVDTSVISSQPLQVCICLDKRLECDQKYNGTIDTVRGKEFTLQAVTVGQNEGIIPSTVRAYVGNSEVPMQGTQNTTKECTPLTFRLSSHQNSTKLLLVPDGPCRDTKISHREITVNFLPCPDGFTLEGAECVCEERLRMYTTNCSVDDNSIERQSSTFWIGAIYDNGSYEGLILHPRCPFDFCVDTPVSVTLDDLDTQCDYNHSGTLCSSCKQNFSIAFGTLHCLSCSSAYLALLFPFGLAGIALVALLLLLNLTVATGTISGLIFYANVIQANKSVFFPHGKSSILTIFIAWLNLDLGIETCFYDGMNAYVFTWLQFLFPFYVWFLIGLIIVASRFSDRIARTLGNNPVAMLATLILISYSKILRTVIVALSYTNLEYPNNNRKIVWLYDASVAYFQRVDHIVLGVFALAVLVILFLPFTFLLLCGQCLQVYSDTPVFSWINRIKPFLDAYYAPYKKGTRYWTGALLLVRCVLSLTFAFNVLGNASANLLAVTSLTAGLAILAWLHGGLYEKLYNNILEAAFILNLCIFVSATYHVSEIGGSQAELTYTSVGLAFAIFVFIVLFHIYLRIRKMKIWKKQLKPASACMDKIMLKYVYQKADDENEALEESDDGTMTLSMDSESVRSPTTTTIELHKPMLEKF